MRPLEQIIQVNLPKPVPCSGCGKLPCHEFDLDSRKVRQEIFRLVCYSNECLLKGSAVESFSPAGCVEAWNKEHAKPA